MKRRGWILVLAAVMALAVFTAAAEDYMVLDNATTQYSTMYVYTRNGKPLHMREQPSREAAVVRDLPYGSQVSVIYEENLTWAYVQYGNTTGFVMRSYLVTSMPASNNSSSSGSSAASTGDLAAMNQEFKSLRLVSSYPVYSSPLRASGFVNLRFAPSLEATVASICYDGHALTVIAETTSWYQVEDAVSGYTGYIMKQYTRRRR